MGKYKSKGTTGYKTTYKPTYVNNQCHTGFYEIYPNLFMGAKMDVTRDLCNKVDVLIPLDSLDAKIWEFGYNGDILYIPTADFGTLPKAIELTMIDKVLDLLREGKKIAIFCLGGHGRTGYFVGCILAELGIKDPIKLMWDEYCKSAVESLVQLEAISEYLPRSNREEFRENYREQLSFYSISSSYLNNSWWKDMYEYDTPTKKDIADFDCFKDILNNKICGDCQLLENNLCCVDGLLKGNCDKACEDFVE